MAPFFGELGVHPLAEPGLLLAPAQALREQELVDPAALDRDALRFVQVRFQAVQRPGGKGQAQALGDCVKAAAITSPTCSRCTSPDGRNGRILQPGQALWH